MGWAFPFFLALFFIRVADLEGHSAKPWLVLLGLGYGRHMLGIPNDSLFLLLEPLPLILIYLVWRYIQNGRFIPKRLFS